MLLVLLIIFMAALPLTQKGLDVDLPLETRPPATPGETRQIMLEFNADRTLAVNKQPVSIGSLEGYLRGVFEERPGTPWNLLEPLGTPPERSEGVSRLPSTTKERDHPKAAPLL